MNKRCCSYWILTFELALIMICNPLEGQKEIWKHYPAFYFAAFHSSGKLNCLVSTNQILLLDSLCQNIKRTVAFTSEDFADLSYKKIKSVTDGSIYILGKKYIYKFNESSIDSILLPASNVYNRFLAEDNGIIWIGAYGKASFYKDGVWYDFKPEVKDQFLKVVNDFSFQDFKKDRNGNLWFSTNYGLTKYDGKNYYSYSTRFGYLKGLDVFDFDIDTNGVVYALNGNYNIGIFLSIIDSIHKVHLPDMQNTRVMVDKENYVWFGSNKPGYLDDKTIVDYTETGNLSGFHLDIHGNLNYILDNHKIVQVTNSGKQIVDFNKFGYITNGAGGLCIDSFGTEWIYNSQLRKLHFEFNKDSIIQFKEDNDGFRISSIKIDTNNNFWISGDYQKNVIRFNPYHSKIQYYALPKDDLFRFIPNTSNKIILYTSSGIYEIKDSAFTEVDLNPCKILERSINSTAMNTRGDINILSYDKLLLNTENNCSEYYFPSFRNNSYVHPIEIWILRNDKVYILFHKHDTINSETDFILANFINGEFYEIDFSLGNSFVNSMNLDLNGNLWIAKRESLYKIDTSGKVTDYGITVFPYLENVSEIIIGNNSHIYFISWKGVSELIEEEITSTVGPDKTSLQIYPNPSTGKVFIKSFEKIESLSIFSSSGVLLRSINNPEQEIDIENSGLYYLRATTLKSIHIVKLIVIEN